MSLDRTNKANLKGSVDKLASARVHPCQANYCPDVESYNLQHSRFRNIWLFYLLAATLDEDTKPPPCSSQEHLNRVIVSSPSFHSISFVARTCWICLCQNFFWLTMNCDPRHFLHAGAHRVVCLQTQIVFQNNCQKPVVRLIITSRLMMILITGTFSMFWWISRL